MNFAGAPIHVAIVKLAGFTVILPLMMSVTLQAAALDEAALEFRTFPEGPVYAHELNHGLHISDIFLHNLAIINKSAASLDVHRVLFSVMSSETVLSNRIMERDEIEASADRLYRNGQYGVFERLPELFGHDQMFGAGEELSATPLLEPKSALLAIQNYFSFQGSADALRVSVDYALGADPSQMRTATFSIPIKRYKSDNVYRMPLKGRWFVLTGPDIADHHRNWQNTEFAYDFSRTDNGGSQFSKQGYAPADYYAYGQPVFAVADGIVEKAIDQFPEAPLRMKNETVAEYQTRMSDRMNENFANNPDANYGNIVVIAHENGEFSSYTHLKRGSIRVKVGDRVKAGARLGDVGQSGNSLKPHLHFDVTLASGRSVPVEFTNAHSLDGETLSRLLKTGEFISAE